MNWLPKKTVVVPIDFSPQSFAALDHALELVEDASHLYAVHVLPVLLVAEPGVIWETVSDVSRKEHAAQLLRKQTADPKFAQLNAVILIGDPGREITGLAEQVKADLIVLP